MKVQIRKRCILDTPSFILTERKWPTFIVLLVLILVGATSGCLGSYTRLPAEDSRVTVAREQCDVDLDSDGDCDRDDTRLLAKAIGACKNTHDYYERADVDGDGCVTTNDQELLFPMFSRDVEGRSCDLDGDGDCDRNDYRLFSKSLRLCFDMVIEPKFVEAGLVYNPFADANRDGCVLGDDMILLFPVIP